MYGYIYKRQNKINKKIYIGKHKYHLPQLDESYRGSGKLLLRSIAKYGEENFTYELVDTADSIEELNALEKHYIEAFNCVHPNGYNISSGGDGGDTFTLLPEEDKAERVQRMRSSQSKTTIVHKGSEMKRIKVEHLEEFLNNGYEKGVSDERKEQNRQSRLKFLADHPEWVPKNTFEKGHIPWNVGVPMREESREKLVKCNTGKKQSPETVAKRNATHAQMRAEGWDPFRNVDKNIKYMHITDGVNEKRVPVGSLIPDEWQKGRKPHKTNNRIYSAWNKGISNTKLKDTVWVCSESSRKQVSKEELEYWMSQGWRKGMTFKQ